MKSVLTIVLTITINFCFSQSTFIYWDDGLADEIPLGIYESSKGELFISIVSFDDFIIDFPKILKLDENGYLLDSIEIVRPGYSCYLDNLIEGKDSSVLAFGAVDGDTVNYLWLIEIDYDFNILNEITHPLPGRIVSYIHTEVSENNTVFVSFTSGSINNTVVHLIEMKKTGEVINTTIYDENGTLNMVNELYLDTNNGSFKLFSSDLLEKSPSFVHNIDSTFNVISSKLLDIDLLSGNTATEYTNGYYLSGMYLSSSNNSVDMIINKMNYSDSALFKKEFGNPNEDEFLSKDNLNYNDPNNIFLTGTTGVTLGNLEFSEHPTEVIITVVDSNLNIKNTNYIGGDACYLVLRSNITQDGGLVISTSRYDHKAQNLERDPYIIKVDSGGLLTSIIPTKEEKPPLSIYPNPGFEFFYLISPGIEGSIEVYDCLGRSMIKVSIEPGTNMISTAQLFEGVYIYRVTGEDGSVYSGKWIKN